MSASRLTAHAVILAGGRGTRFWPRSRTRTPKQLLNIVGKRTMLQQTVERLKPVFPASRVWVVTNNEQAKAVRVQVPRLGTSRVLSEPVGRNTAAAIGLAAVHILRQSKSSDALMAVLPADHYIGQPEKFLQLLRAALDLAARGDNLVVLGIPPTRPDTGFGYIERGERSADVGGAAVFQLRRFTEKPELSVAKEYVASGRYDWNAGMFFWRVSTFLDRLKRYLPATHDALLRLAETIGTRRYASALKRMYPKLENISVDYAIMERATREPDAKNVFVLPAEVGWSDIGSWAAVYELLAKKEGDTVAAGSNFNLDGSGNFLWSPEKFIAVVGVHNLVVVETDDALLICPRDRAQDVGKVVKWLEEKRLKTLL